MNLLAGLYSQDDLRRYFIRQRCSPQPGMRCVEKSARSYICWLYEGYAWNRREWCVTGLRHGSGGSGTRGCRTSNSSTVSWPTGRISGTRWHATGVMSSLHTAGRKPRPPSRSRPRRRLACVRTRWGRIRPRLARSSTGGCGTCGRPRMFTGTRAASSLDDLRGACPVRSDVSPKLRCVVLAEAIVLLGRRPHVEAYVGIDDAPPGVAAEAAAVLSQFDLPRSALALLVR